MTKQCIWLKQGVIQKKKMKKKKSPFSISPFFHFLFFTQTVSLDRIELVEQSQKQNIFFTQTVSLDRIELVEQSQKQNMSLMLSNRLSLFQWRYSFKHYFFWHFFVNIVVRYIHSCGIFIFLFTQLGMFNFIFIIFLNYILIDFLWFWLNSELLKHFLFFQFWCFKQHEQLWYSS